MIEILFLSYKQLGPIPTRVAESSTLFKLETINGVLGVSFLILIIVLIYIRSRRDMLKQEMEVDLKTLEFQTKLSSTKSDSNQSSDCSTRILTEKTLSSTQYTNVSTLSTKETNLSIVKKKLS
jgi:hypothetical protein